MDMEADNMQKNKRIFMIIIMSLLVLSACASKPAPLPTPIETKAVRLEKRAQADMQMQDYAAATKSAHDALRLYAALDDRAGQLRSHINLTRLFILQRQPDRAEKHLLKAREIVKETDDSAQRYQVHLLTGKFNNDAAEFTLARETANSLLEQAVAETYLAHYEAAKQLVDKLSPNLSIRTEVDDTAFVMLQYARFADDFDSATLALTLYKSNENTIGISDSLYVLAMISRKQGNKLQADNYLQRALEVNLAIGDKRRIAATLEAIAGQVEK